MKTAAKVVVILVIAAMLFATGIVTASYLEIEYYHFEDGSGRLTYCLPWEICHDGTDW